MLLYSIVPYEKIFESPAPTAPEFKRISGGYVELSKNESGYEVSRVISTDPRVYLNERFYPGSVFPSGK